MSEDARRTREAALGRLVEQGTITVPQAQAVSRELDRAETRSGVRWSEVVGYIGGGLVLAAVATFAAASWNDLTVLTRVLLLAAAVPVLAAAGVAMAGGPKALGAPRDRVPKVRRRIGGSLFALASLAAMLAVQVYVVEMLSGLEDDLLFAGAAGLTVAVGGYVLLRSAPGAVAAWAMSLMVVGGVLTRVHDALGIGGGAFFYGGSDHDLVMGLNGGGYILLGAVWVAVALAGAVAERGTAIGLGAATAFVGAELLPTPWNHLGVLLVAAVLLGLYAWRRAGALLVFGIIAATIGVPQLVWHLTDGQVSAAAVLGIAGAVLLAASWIGVRLHQTGRQGPAEGDGGADDGGGGSGEGDSGEGSDGAPEPSGAPASGGSPPSGGTGGPAPGQDPPGSQQPIPKVDPRDPDERL